MGIPLACSLLLSLAFAGHSFAQSMYRCVGKHGEPTFSDRRCMDPPRRVQPADAAHPQSTPVPGYRTCLAEPVDLRDAVAAALQRDERLRLSGLLLWSSPLADQNLRRLLEIAGQPLRELTLEWRDGAHPVLVIHSTADPHGVPRARQTVFHMHPSRGCWWLVEGPHQGVGQPWPARWREPKSSMATAPPWGRGASDTSQPYSSHNRRTMARPSPAPLPPASPRTPRVNNRSA